MLDICVTGEKTYVEARQTLAAVDVQRLQAERCKAPWRGPQAGTLVQPEYTQFVAGPLARKYAVREGGEF